MYLGVWMLLFGFCQSLNMNDILHELSWRLKLKVLNLKNEPASTSNVEHTPPPVVLLNVTTSTTIAPPMTLTPGEADSIAPPTTILPIDEDDSINSISTNTTIPKEERTVEVASDKIRRLLKSPEQKERSVGIQHLRQYRRDDAADNQAADDNDMRLKLFRLMYETVRDSDVKVKRAELIKEHYANSSTFEIGYLIGDITDKSNIINDISTTLKRFYHEWKPIEHINAYEQIANQAIEITHLVDLVRVINKKDRDDNAMKV